MTHCSKFSDPILLESFSGFYTSKFQYRPTRSEILLFGHIDMANFCPSISRSLLVPLPTLYPSFPLDKIVQHPAMVFIPYSVNAFKQTELYSVSMPLVMPSINYFRTHYFGSDRTCGSKYYCNKPEVGERPGHPSSKHPYSPNVEVKGDNVVKEDLEAELYWLKFADFFTRPHILHFDNCSHLDQLLHNTDFSEVHNNLNNEVKRKQEKLLNQWKHIIETI